MGMFDRVPLPKKIYIKVDDVDDKDIYFMAQDKLENMDNGKIGIYKLETVTSLPLEAIIHKE